jgi:hypothetical protein
LRQARVSGAAAAADILVIGERDVRKIRAMEGFGAFGCVVRTPLSPPSAPEPSSWDGRRCHSPWSSNFNISLAAFAQCDPRLLMSL